MIVDCIGDFEMYNACPAFLQPKGDYIVVGAPISKGVGGFVKMVGRIGAALFGLEFLVERRDGSRFRLCRLRERRWKGWGSW